MSSQSVIDTYYSDLQRAFDVRVAPDYARLVVPNGNGDEPVHRWFHMKEAYSAGLLPRLLKELELVGSDSLRILDPFCGVGTTLVSALNATLTGDLRNPTIYGIETNPFLYLTASAKVNAIVAPRKGFFEFARAVAGDAHINRTEYLVPELSTFHNPRYFAHHDVQSLLRLRAGLEARANADEPELFLTLAAVALGASVEPSSNLRKDGRALRFVQRELGESPIDVFLERCRTIDEDIPFRRASGRANVLLGDGVSMRQIDGRFVLFDLLVCSPPYPNNIDYTEVYKLENWLLGLIDSNIRFSAQRAASVHSHPSIKRSARIDQAALSGEQQTALKSLVAPIVDALPRDRYMRARQEVIEGYVLDMFLALQAGRKRLRCGGRIVIVVGNSVHGAGSASHVIAADLLIAQVARLNGLVIDHIAIARLLRRRGSTSPFLRESLIFATNPDTRSR